MRKFRRGLASLLAAVLLVSVLPTAALAREEDPPGTEDEVTYNLLDFPVTVGTDSERAGEDPYGYRLFNEDGNYTIQAENDAFFPYEVQFTYEGETWSEWFLDQDDTISVGGHIFSIHSDASDGGAVLTALALRVSGETVPVYPEEKTFSDSPRPAPMSLLPLDEQSLSINLRNYLPSELEHVQVSAVLSGTGIADSPAVVWAKGIGNDDFVITYMNGTINLRPEDKWSSAVELELIVGTADQLDPDNIRYQVHASVTPSDELLTFTVASETSRQPISVYQSNQGEDQYQISVAPENWSGSRAYLGMALNSAFSGLTAAVYSGSYESEAAALAGGAEEITDKIWNQSGLPDSGGYLADYSYRNAPEVTLVLKRNGTPVQTTAFTLFLYKSEIYVSFNSLKDPATSSTVVSRRSTKLDSENNAILWTISLRAGVPTGPHLLTLSADDPNPASVPVDSYGSNLVTKAVEGLYTSLSEAASRPDIKGSLFSDAGYIIDPSYNSPRPGFGGGDVAFTVFTTGGECSRLIIRVQRTTENLPPAPKPDREDTYFSMTGAQYRDRHGNDSSDYYSLESYVMPYDADGYYYGYAESDVNFGYQTVFLLDSDGTAVNDGEVIIPSFASGTGVKIYASVSGGQSAVEQTSDVSELTFESGKVVPYSARTDNSTNALKNYWVTFVTQQSGPKLFVNAANDTARYDETENIPVREVYLDDAHGNHHEVFFANIGDTALTGLSVELVDPVNVALDDYWTINAGGTKSLAAFTTVDKTKGHGELPNMAKLRLVPAEGSSGEVSGTLVIKADMGTPDTNDDQEIRIKLTGYAGAVGITTTSIVDAVRYVPYSSVIQTNAMGSSSAVTFSLEADTLPNGVVLRSNGELYGVPTVTGSFPITVKAVSNSNPTLSDTASFTLNVLSNTDANVASSIDTGYEFVTDSTGDGRVPATLTAYSDYMFHSNGAHGEFQAFWLDGRKLADGRDYDAEEGSTKITIRAQTFRAAGEGTHTIAAEFRQGGSTTGALKRTAQNYTSTVSDRSDDDDDDRGSGSARPATPVKPTTPENTAVRGFLDVQTGDWCAADVAWAYDNGYIKGFSATRFSPNSPVTPVTAVVILARLSGADLDAYTDAGNANVPAGQWYTPHAVWAREAGILPARDFVAGRHIPRGELAVMLVNYLKSMGIDCAVPTPRTDFADAAEMTQEANDAFQVLYAFGIFKGKGNYVMDPAGSTTRAQMAALMHRLSAFVAERG